MINKIDARHRVKRSIIAGKTPTVPGSSDFTDGTWIDTDIRAGEFYFNVPDNKLWIGTPTGSISIPLTGTPLDDLANVLLAGNFTGASDIIMSTNQTIKSANGGGQIELDHNSNAGDILISTDSGAGAQSIIELTTTDVSISSTTDININSSNIVSIFGTSNVLNVTGVINPSNQTFMIGSSNTINNGTTNNYSIYENIILGDKHTLTTSDTSTIVGNIISGSTNSIISLTSSSSNIVGGSNNSLTSSSYNIVGGGGNLSTSSSGNSVNGVGNSLTSSNSNSISGTHNSLTSSSGNNVSGSFISIETVNRCVVTGIGSDKVNTAPSSTSITGVSKSLIVANLYNTYVAKKGLAGSTTNTGTTNIGGTVINTNSSHYSRLTVLGVNTTTGDSVTFKGEGLIKNVAGTVSLVGSFTITQPFSDTSLLTSTCVVTANNTTKALDINVTGVASSVINWSATIEMERVNYN